MFLEVVIHTDHDFKLEEKYLRRKGSRDLGDWLSFLPEFLSRLNCNMLISFIEKVHKSYILKNEWFQKKTSALPVSTFFPVDPEALGCELSIELTKTCLSSSEFCVSFVPEHSQLHQEVPGPSLFSIFI